MNSPLSNKSDDRCIPHPTQSTPNNDLFMQGNRYFSKSKSDNILMQFNKNLAFNSLFACYYFKVTYF